MRSIETYRLEALHMQDPDLLFTEHCCRFVPTANVISIFEE